MASNFFEDKSWEFWYKRYMDESRFVKQAQKYKIEYDIWAQDVAETGNRSYMKALNPLLKEGGMSDVRTDP